MSRATGAEQRLGVDTKPQRAALAAAEQRFARLKGDRGTSAEQRL